MRTGPGPDRAPGPKERNATSLPVRRTSGRPRPWRGPGSRARRDRRRRPPACRPPRLAPARSGPQRARREQDIGGDTPDHADIADLRRSHGPVFCSDRARTAPGTSCASSQSGIGLAPAMIRSAVPGPAARARRSSRIHLLPASDPAPLRLGQEHFGHAAGCKRWRSRAPRRMPGHTPRPDAVRHGPGQRRRLHPSWRGPG
ncbi:hypothetical protein XINFAN_00715 [Pseudogemmobacter humi]|uniref:Uncharacterized protein n=1 Tax=Pseudogemmobacter humi TaxID=2483812 RepID=A0A3P5X4W9_9RHOB|nr:hypothetical protein XINFAN_00715 [Pseudogemmobacter humi]